ncbi:hypothetical protein LOAG_05040, partial [Loa loa]
DLQSGVDSIHLNSIPLNATQINSAQPQRTPIDSAQLNPIQITPADLKKPIDNTAYQSFIREERKRGMKMRIEREKAKGEEGKEEERTAMRYASEKLLSSPCLRLKNS